MAHKVHHFDRITVNSDNMTLDLHFNHIERNFNNAQYELDTAIMNSMQPFMPMQDGNLINTTKAESAALAGSGQVVAATGSYGRFLYEGATMVDEKTGSPWARKGARKVPVSQFGGKTNARSTLSFSQSKHPQAQPHWFDPAKEKDLDEWVKVVKKEIGK